MLDVLAEMARERGVLFVGKIELHLDKVPWVRMDFNTTSDRRFQNGEVIWSRSTPRACKSAIKLRQRDNRWSGDSPSLGGRHYASFSGCVPVEKPARRNSQHATTEEGVIQRQSDDRAYCSDASAVNALEIEASQPAAVK